MLTIINEKKKEYSMFISINANDHKLSSEIYYYYPNESVEIDKFVIKPDNPSVYTHFYKKNIQKYEEISQCVVLIVALNSSRTAYTSSIGNFINLKDGKTEESTLITSFSLLKLPEAQADEDLRNVEIYMVQDTSNTYQFFKKMEFLISTNVLLDKINYFDVIKEKYCLVKMDPNIAALNYRSEFIKLTQSSEFDYMFRDPITDKLAAPALDVLLLNYSEKEDNVHPNSKIIIDLDSYQTYDEQEKTDQFLTFVTHHIPRQKVQNIIGKSRKYIKSCENPQVPNSKKNKQINYEHIRDLEFSKSCCVYYDKSINYGRRGDYNIGGLSVGYYSFNTFSAGTLLYDYDLNPLGLAYFGSYDFYPLTQLKQLYNLFIPFDHIGLQYVLRKFLNPELKITEYLKSRRIDIDPLKKTIKRIPEDIIIYKSELGLK
jgi:hypothetical protein